MLRKGTKPEDAARNIVHRYGEHMGRPRALRFPPSAASLILVVLCCLTAAPTKWYEKMDVVEVPAYVTETRGNTADDPLADIRALAWLAVSVNSVFCDALMFALFNAHDC